MGTKKRKLTAIGTNPPFVPRKNRSHRYTASVAFDDQLFNKEYTSRSDAYKMLALESTKKYKVNIIRQFPKS